ncbi:MAG: energy-coupling factor ABC transporter permease [Spirochaetota bacterium]
MHLGDGVAGPTLTAGISAVSLALAAWSLKNTPNEKIPRVALVTAAFFSISLLNVRIGVTSAHLLLNGLAGVLLGPSAFIAVAAALVLQAVMFQHGGITAIGINSFVMGLPALATYAGYRVLVRRRRPSRRVIGFAGFSIGFISVALSAALLTLVLCLCGREFRVTAGLLLAAEAPLVVVEGVVSAFALLFFDRAAPGILYGRVGT